MNASEQFGAIFVAVIMIVSMVATGAVAVGTAGAPPEPTTETPALSNPDTTEREPDQSVSTRQTTAISNSQPAQVADQLENASGETTVILFVDRDIQQSLIESGEATSAELRQDSQQTLQPVENQVDRLSTATVQQEFWVGNALSVEIDLTRSHISTLAQIPGVTSVIPNVQYETPPQPALNSDANSSDIRPEGVTPSLEQGEFTYGLQKIGIPSFEEQFDTHGEGTTVAILDNGISNPDEGHPDLEFAQTAIAADGVVKTGTLGSPGEHGEHVAGTATGAADPAGDVPRYGVAPNASLIKINVFENGAFNADIIAGLQYAVEQDADVAGMSLGAVPRSDQNPVSNSFDRAIDDANAAGTLVSVSAGNSGDGDAGGPVTSPAPEFGAFSVGASGDDPVNLPLRSFSSISANTGSNNDIAEFSSGGVISDETAVDSFAYPNTYPRKYVQPDVAAPGVLIISAGPLGVTDPSLVDDSATYSIAQGTSMAQPHVAGAVALIQSATAKDLGPKQIEAALVETAEKPADGFTELHGRDIRYGAGIINVTAATLAAQSENLEITGSITDSNGNAIVGATVESEDGALTATNETGQYTLQTTSPETNITTDAFGHVSATSQVDSSGTVNLTLADQLSVGLVQGQPTVTEIGGQFDIEVDVRALENLTVSLNDSVSATVTTEDISVTLTTKDGLEVPVSLGEPINERLDGFTGLANITVSISETADVTAGNKLLFDHTFIGTSNTVSVTTGPTRLVDAAGTVSSVSIDADFIGTVNDQPTTRVTATGVVKDGAQSDGDKLTFTIDGQPVDTAVTSGGEATGVVFAETLDLEPQEDVTVDVREFETAQTDTVDTVDEVIELETGFNLRSVPQPATLKTQEVSSLNRWNSETQTYEAITSSVFDSAADLHNGLYIRATSDEARIGLTFDQNGSVNATEDINTQWNLVGTNVAIDNSRDGEVQIDQDLANMGVSALNLSSDDGQSLDENSTVDVFQAYWAHNPTETVDERAIVSPGYDEQSRRALLGSYSSQPSDSNFQPRITNITTTTVPDADSRITLNDREGVGASEQVVLVDVSVENKDSGIDVQFVTLEVAPQFGGDRENASFECVDQTGIVLGAGSGSVTLAYVASQDDVNMPC